MNTAPLEVCMTSHKRTVVELVAAGGSTGKSREIKAQRLHVLTLDAETDGYVEGPVAPETFSHPCFWDRDSGEGVGTSLRTGFLESATEMTAAWPPTLGDLAWRLVTALPCSREPNHFVQSKLNWCECIASDSSTRDCSTTCFVRIGSLDRRCTLTRRTSCHSHPHSNIASSTSSQPNHRTRDLSIHRPSRISHELRQSNTHQKRSLPNQSSSNHF